jgi:pimeloyl-ACP methyl ester carboxylesterase
VLVPTLTGLGERAHLASPDVGLSTHVLDVVNCLNWEDVHEAVLVGHSYGGLVITGAADRALGRLRHLVYVDALVPRDGQSWRSVVPDEARWAGLDREARERGGGWLLPHPGEAGLRGWGVDAPADLAWALARLTPQPLASSREPLMLVDRRRERPGRTYVWADYKPTGDRFARFRDEARAPGSGWRYREVAAGHDAMLTAPRAVAGLLLELA